MFYHNISTHDKMITWELHQWLVNEHNTPLYRVYNIDRLNQIRHETRTILGCLFDPIFDRYSSAFTYIIEMVMHTSRKFQKQCHLNEHTTTKTSQLCIKQFALVLDLVRNRSLNWSSLFLRHHLGII